MRGLPAHSRYLAVAVDYLEEGEATIRSSWQPSKIVLRSLPSAMAKRRAWRLHSCRVITDLRYPIGRFQHVAPASDAVRRTALDALTALPSRMRQAVEGLDDAQLDTPYRPGGWTVRQVVHHVADSHMNAYIRLKLALTEDTPTIKPYDENAWATLADTRLPIELSLALLDGVHAPLGRALRALMDAATSAAPSSTPSTDRHLHARLAAAALRLALAPSRRPHHRAAGTRGLVEMAVLASNEAEPVAKTSDETSTSATRSA